MNQKWCKNKWQVRDAESDECPLLGFPPHSRRRDRLLHHNAHGDHLEDRDWGVCVAKRLFIIFMHWSCKSRILKDLGKFNLQWYAGNLACKALMMVRTSGYILKIIMIIDIIISIIIILRWGQAATFSPPWCSLCSPSTGETKAWRFQHDNRAI